MRQLKTIEFEGVLLELLLEDKEPYKSFSINKVPVPICEVKQVVEWLINEVLGETRKDTAYATKAPRIETSNHLEAIPPVVTINEVLGPEKNHLNVPIPTNLEDRVVVGQPKFKQITANTEKRYDPRLEAHYQTAASPTEVFDRK